MSVNIRRWKKEPQALCDDCDRLPEDATRERVRQHAAILGHTAHVVVDDVTTYTRKASG